MSFWESHIDRCVMHLLTHRIQAHATRLQPDQDLKISTSDVRGNSDQIRLLRIGVQLKTFRLVVRIPTWRNSDKIQVSRSYNYLLVTSSEALPLHYNSWELSPLSLVQVKKFMTVYFFTVWTEFVEKWKFSQQYHGHEKWWCCADN